MTFSDEIIKLINALAEKFGIAINWTSDNIIPYLEFICTKYVNYEYATSMVWIVIGAVMLVLGPVLLKLSHMWYKKETGENRYLDWDDFCSWAFLISLIFGAIFILTGIIVIITQVFDIVACKAFPEKIIIDELKSLINNHGR